MDVAFKDESLDRLETELAFNSGFGDAIVKAYEKLRGREGQYSMRLNDQWRLIVELHGEPPRKTVFIVGIEDYH
jgi:toxin HigB-1